MISSRKKLTYHLLQVLRARGFLIGMVFFVLVPTLIAGFFYLFIASDVYISEAKYAIDIDEDEAQTGLLPLLAGSNTSKKDKALLAREYIKSRTLLATLDKKLNLKLLYQNESIPSFQRLSSDASAGSFMRFYNRMVELKIDELASITHIKVRGFSAEDAQQINKAILDHTEHYINELSARIQIDSLVFARIQMEDAQRELIEATQAISRFRNAYQEIDPTQRSTSVFSIIQQLESTLALTRAELAEAQDFMKDDSPKIGSLRARIAALEEEIAEQSMRLTGDEDLKLSDLSEEYEALKLEREFAVKRYELALQNLELAQADAQKKRIYLLRIVEPTLPDSASEPQRGLRILETFLISLVAYLVLALIIEGIGDHMKPRRRN